MGRATSEVLLLLVQRFLRARFKNRGKGLVSMSISPTSKLRQRAAVVAPDGL